MSSQASEIILLCEDQTHERLTREFLKKCGVKNLERVLRPLVVGGYTHVLDRFPIELKACRHRHRTRARTLLVVIIDADQHSTEARRRQMFERAKTANLEDAANDEVTAVLIPKRNIETWIGFLLGEAVNESDDYKHRLKLKKEEFRTAANKLFDLIVLPSAPNLNDLPSLSYALPDWKKAGQRS